MIAAEKQAIRGISRKINEMNIPNQRPIVEYVSNEFKKSLPIPISTSKESLVECLPEPMSVSPSPTDGFLKNLKGRLNAYY